MEVVPTTLHSLPSFFLLPSSSCQGEPGRKKREGRRKGRREGERVAREKA